MPCDSTTSGPSPVTSYAILPPATSRNSVMSASIANSVSFKANLISHGCQAASHAGGGAADGDAGQDEHGGPGVHGEHAGQAGAAPVEPVAGRVGVVDSEELGDTAAHEVHREHAADGEAEGADEFHACHARNDGRSR